jgi:DNA modification methylase
MINLLHGDCLEQMKTLDDNSVDSIVSDPPYGISFMAKKWDYDVPSVEVWKEAMRVLKPGGHALIACGTRTQHRMVVNIEDAGFEIRDVVSWIYGSGFPKSLNISKAIDKMDAAEAQLARQYKFTEWVRSQGVQASDINASTATAMGCRYTTHPSQPAIMTREHLEACRHLFAGVPKWVEAECDKRSVESENFKQREVLETETRYNEPSGIVAAGRDERTLIERKITAPATEAAKQWDGWGTALKPSTEYFTLCRKPLSEKTIAANVLKWGTGGINIDGCRVEANGEKLGGGMESKDCKSFKGKDGWDRPWRHDDDAMEKNAEKVREKVKKAESLGRFPANLIHDGSQEVLDLFPETNQGSAARFFYCAKASKKDRDEGLDGMKLVVVSLQSCEKNTINQEKLATLLVDMETSHLKDTGEFGTSLKNAKEWNTSLFGSRFTEPFQKECKSTTSTETNSTIESRILNALQHSITSDCTLVANLEMANGGSPAASADQCNTLTFTISEKMASALGVKSVVSETLLKISVEDGRNVHSTVKPTALMRYLCRLITPAGGTVLDPYMGSGSTGKAAMLEGFNFVGCEIDDNYFDIARSRIENAAPLFI